jgi:hypothetical protein
VAGPAHGPFGQVQSGWNPSPTMATTAARASATPDRQMRMRTVAAPSAQSRPTVNVAPPNETTRMTQLGSCVAGTTPGSPATGRLAEGSGSAALAYVHTGVHRSVPARAMNTTGTETIVTPMTRSHRQRRDRAPRAQ